MLFKTIIIGIFWVLACFVIFSKIAAQPLAWVWNELHSWINWHKHYSPYQAVEIARNRTNGILRFVVYLLPIFFVGLFFLSFEKLLSYTLDIPEENRNYYILIGGVIPLVFWILILTFTPLTSYFRSSKYPDTFDIDSLPDQDDQKSSNENL